MIEELVLV